MGSEIRAPATLVEAISYATADAGSIPAVSTFRTALRISGGRFVSQGSANPALGLLDDPSSLRIVRKQRGLRLAALKLSRDRPRSRHRLTIELGSRHSHVGKSESLKHHPGDDGQKIGALVIDSLAVERREWAAQDTDLDAIRSQRPYPRA